MRFKFDCYNEGIEKYRKGDFTLRFSSPWKKKIYQVIDRLINQEWKTSFTQDCEKELTFRGIYGKYEITVEDETGVKTVEVDLNDPVILDM